MKLASFILCVFLFSCSEKSEYAQKQPRFEERTMAANANSKIKSDQFYLFKSESFEFGKDFTVRKMDGEKVKLKDLCKNELTLFLRFSGLNCGVCVESELENISKLEKKDKEKLYFLISNEERRQLHLLFVKYKDFKKNVYILDDSIAGLPIEQANVPYFFVIDRNNTISHLFLPDKVFPDLTGQYLKILSEKI